MSDLPEPELNLPEATPAPEPTPLEEAERRAAFLQKEVETLGHQLQLMSDQVAVLNKANGSLHDTMNAEIVRLAKLAGVDPWSGPHAPVQAPAA